jgi:hypothetical protein
MSNAYRDRLATLEGWDDYLLAESRLPGPRANLELASSAAELADEQQIERWLTYTPIIAPSNTPEEFLAFCGVLGLGERLARGEYPLINRLREYANDPRWRIREAVAMGLQRYGRSDMSALLTAMGLWCDGSLLEKRAAAAGLCEPVLLADQQHTEAVLKILDKITASIFEVDDRKSEEFMALRKGLAYCWSVAVAAYPKAGKAVMQSWFTSSDKDIRWIMVKNLKKNRLQRTDPTWVSASLDQLTWR